MKKLKGFDSRQLKQFFMLHGEKIGFGLSMLVVALFCYGAISQQPYDKTPQQLDDKIQQARRNIEQLTEIPREHVPPPPKFMEIAQRSHESVPANEFATTTPYHPGVVKLGSRRGQPEILPVDELYVTTGSAPFALKNPDLGAKFALQNPTTGPGVPGPGVAQQQATRQPVRPQPPRVARGTGRGGLLGLVEDSAAVEGGGEGFPMGSGEGMAFGGVTEQRGVQAAPDNLVQGVRWACITGLVPYKGQRTKFFDEFSNAQYTDPNKDEPYWLGYLVERAEITDPNDTTNLQWKEVSVVSAKKFADTWAVRAPEVVDPAYTHENLTFPLGPMLERDWGKEVAHPKIPVLDRTQRGMTAGQDLAQAEGAAPAIQIGGGTTASNDLEQILNQRKRQAASSIPGVRTAPVQRYSAPRSPYGRSFEGEGAPGALYGGRMQPGYIGGEGGEGFAATSEGTKELEYLLFRFFDFTVEEGKLYRYRVQLVVDNPNYGVRTQYLKDAALAKDPYLLSPWSKPSEDVSVSGYNFLFAGPVKPADKPISEPQVNLITVQLEPKTGLKAAYELRPYDPRKGDKGKREMLPANRGQLIRFTAKADLVHPITRIPKEETVNFDANLTVLDIRGGQRFSPDSFTDRDTIPGEVLLMDGNGKLMSRSESADEFDYQAEAERLEALRLAKENKTTVPDAGFPGGEGGFRGRGEGG